MRSARNCACHNWRIRHMPPRAHRARHRHAAQDQCGQSRREPRVARLQRSREPRIASPAKMPNSCSHRQPPRAGTPQPHHMHRQRLRRRRLPPRSRFCLAAQPRPAMSQTLPRSGTDPPSLARQRKMIRSSSGVTAAFRCDGGKGLAWKIRAHTALIEPPLKLRRRLFTI